VSIEDRLPEVTRLHDARGERQENAAGIGDFWYEPEVWSLPLSPTSKVLYAGLCSYLGHGEINRRDLRNTLKDWSDAEITKALEALIHHNLLVPEPAPREGLANFAVLSVKEFDA
jgi:hypothetical protein